MSVAKVASRILIIDCSIAHAAGPEDAKHPTSKNCRDFLLAVLRICHRIGMSRAVADEWKRHRSGFARQWLVSMHARRKVALIRAEEDASLREVISTLAKTDKACRAMLKDVHLLESAAQSDRRVAALDETVRRLFAEISQHHKPIRSICWVNPDLEFEEASAWLDAGAPIDKSKQLHSFPV